MLFRFMSQLEYKMRIVCKIQMKNVQGHNSVTLVLASTVVECWSSRFDITLV